MQVQLVEAMELQSSVEVMMAHNGDLLNSKNARTLEIV